MTCDSSVLVKMLFFTVPHEELWSRTFLLLWSTQPRGAVDSSGVNESFVPEEHSCLQDRNGQQESWHGASAAALGSLGLSRHVWSPSALLAELLKLSARGDECSPWLLFPVLFSELHLAVWIQLLGFCLLLQSMTNSHPLPGNAETLREFLLLSVDFRASSWLKKEERGSVGALVLITRCVQTLNPRGSLVSVWHWR